VHGASTGQGERTNVEANNTSVGVGGPVRHLIPLGILIFLVYIRVVLGGLDSVRYLEDTEVILMRGDNNIIVIMPGIRTLQTLCFRNTCF